uniref:C-type lectin domain-containing protein n=1 Tax=Dicentrarchus labrax TaxID=13489 RepID=A0A8P4KPR0_DICLA
MKALLLLSVLLCGALTATAAAVGAAEAAPQELQEDNQISEAENEAGVFVPEEEKPRSFFAGEMAPSAEGRFFACPSGWVRYKSSCYQLVSSSRSWSSAAAHCASLGASLASVHDQFDYSFLQELTRRAGYTISWMGGFYFQGWRWVDQSSFSYSYWSTVNSASSYPCVYLRVSGKSTLPSVTATVVTFS